MHVLELRPIGRPIDPMLRITRPRGNIPATAMLTTAWTTAPSSRVVAPSTRAGARKSTHAGHYQKW